MIQDTICKYSGLAQYLLPLGSPNVGGLLVSRKKGQFKLYLNWLDICFHLSVAILAKTMKDKTASLIDAITQISSKPLLSHNQSKFMSFLDTRGSFE